MIISAIFSKPVKNIEEILERPYKRIRIRAANTAGSAAYFSEAFTEKQAFHKQMTQEELDEFIEKHAGTTFRSCILRTEKEETSILANKKGRITKLTRKTDGTLPSAQSPVNTAEVIQGNLNRAKNHLIPEGTAVPFLVLLGVMTAEGRVISSKYDKFRQINRFLEFINDILPSVIKQTGNRPLRIADFGCGKSYLTFAVHYFLTRIKHIQCEIIGLDLKKDVIDYCRRMTAQLGLEGLNFDTGDIAGYSYKNNPDIVITLHACNTATDYAIDYAIKHNACAILSVPCCQHEMNEQLDNNLKEWKKNRKETQNSGMPEEFLPLLKYGLIKERFASLVTDALRADYIESKGYNVQVLEFIDMEHTPKNILIRAVKKECDGKNQESSSEKNHVPSAIEKRLNISLALHNI